MVFQFKVKQIKKMLKKPNIENSYAKLMETLYGVINVPIKRSSNEFIGMITKDFSGFTEEELKALKRELEQNRLNNLQELSPALKLMDVIPFMKENQENLRRVLKKENKTEK